MKQRGIRLAAFIGLLIFLVGLLIGQLLPQSLAAAAPFSQYLPTILKQLDVSNGPNTTLPIPTPTVVPGGPQYLMLGHADFGIKGAAITGYGVGHLPPGLPMPTPPVPTIIAQPQASNLHLPQGAQITQITAYYSGTTALTADTRIELQRQQMASFETLATLIPTPNQPADTDQVQLIQLAPGVAVIDNSRYSYRVAIYSDRDPFTPFVAYQIRIDYQ